MSRRALLSLAFAAMIPLTHSARLFGESTHFHRGTATVDGVNDPQEWLGAEYGEAILTLPAAFGGGSTPVTLLVMNDDDSLYAALQFPYPSSPAAPAFLDFGVQFWPDGAAPCNPTTPLDVVQLVSQSDVVDFRDEHWPQCTIVVSDTLAGGSIDGTGVWGDEGSTLFFELSHPLDSSDNLHDVSAVLGDFLQLKPFTYGCDAAAVCGPVASLTKRVFLVPDNLIFFGDLEGGDLLEWSLNVP